MAPSPQVPPVVGPAVTVALAQLKFPVVVVAVETVAGTAAAAAAAAAAETAAGTVAGTVVICVTWPTGLLLDQIARAYFQPSQSFLVAGLQGALAADCASLHLTSC